MKKKGRRKLASVVAAHSGKGYKKSVQKSSVWPDLMSGLANSLIQKSEIGAWNFFENLCEIKKGRRKLASVVAAHSVQDY